ncbi:MAG: hypothetical protein IPI65_05630 [Bacteroidetes bacterium]|nr:hypothetical protein [Bacteroidota bacterium]
MKKITTTLLISLITFGTAYNQIAAPSWYKAMCGYDQGNSHVYADDELNIYFSAVFFDTLNFDYTNRYNTGVYRWSNDNKNGSGRKFAMDEYD